MFPTNKIVILLFCSLILSPLTLNAFAVDPKILIKDVVVDQATNPFEIKLTNNTFVFKIDSNGIIQTGRINSFNQLPSTTASSVLVTDSSGYITASSISTTILNFLSTLSSDVQTQINGKQTTTLTDGNILVGSSGNVATSVNPSGDIDVSNTGAFSINNLVIVDGDISGSAGIDASKIGAGGVTSTEFGYIGTLSSDAQTQLDGKQSTITGLTSSGTELNILDGATLSTTELNYVDGVTSDIQSQINGKQASLGFTPGTVDDIKLEGTEISNSRPDLNFNDTSTIDVNVEDSSATTSANVTMSIVSGSIDDAELGTSIDTTQLAGGGVTSSEFDFLADVTSLIQAQINGKQTTTLTDGNILVGSSGNVATSVNPSGDVDISNTGVFSIANIHSIGNVTSIGCASGEILKVSGTSWECASDSTGTGGALDDVLLENVEISNSRANLNFNDTSKINFSIDDDSALGQSNVTATIVSNSIGDAELGSSIDATQIGGGGVTSSEFDFLADVTSLIQAQINGKQATLGYTAENLANKNANNGYAGLGSTGELQIAQQNGTTLYDSDRGIASGLATLNSNSLLQNDQLATNANATENCLKGDRTWGSCSAGSGITEVNTIEGGSARLSNLNSTSELILKNFADSTTVSWTNGTDSLTPAIVANSVDDAELGTGIDTTQLASGGVTSTEFEYINTLSSNAQTQLDARELLSNKNANDGYPSLGSTGQLQKAQQNATTVYTNQANTYSGAGTQDFVGSILDNIASINDNSGAESTSGFVDMANAVLVCWEQAPAGADICISVDLSEDFLFDSDTNNINLNSNPLTNAVLGGQINFNGQTILNTGTLTLPTSTDTLMGKATTDTMTGKTLRTNSTGNAVIADPSLAVLTAGGATLQVSGSPPKTTIDGTNMDYITLSFDPTTDETVIWNFEIPTDVDASQNIAVDIRYLKSTAGASDGVCWSGAFLGRVAGEAVDTSFGTEVLTCDSTINTAGQLDTHHLSFTSAQHALSAGDVVFFKLFRDADNGSDGLTVDIQLIDVKVSWT